jgi:pyridoxine 4-dehydrogenase
MLPIPGTSSVAHLEANVAVATVGLTDDQSEELSKIGQRYAEER